MYPCRHPFPRQLLFYLGAFPFRCGLLHKGEERQGPPQEGGGLSLHPTCFTPRSRFVTLALLATEPPLVSAHFYRPAGQSTPEQVWVLSLLGTLGLQGGGRGPL